MAESREARKPRRVGRRSNRRYTEETRPGKVFGLSLLSALPVLYLFVLVPLLRPTQDPIGANPVWGLLFFFATPALAAAALVLYYRSPPWVRVHNAAKAGRMLGFANGALWLFYGGLYVLFFVIGYGRPSG